MAQHDYDIANGTGAAVRSDINNVLDAVVSQNSGSSAPSTTFSYQLWADTSAGLLKIRNGANNAWVTVGTLDATNLGLAKLASPTFTGNPKSVTPATGDNDTSIATTAFVQGIKSNTALTGVPTAPTATAGTNTTQLATTAFVNTASVNIANVTNTSTGIDVTNPIDSSIVRFTRSTNQQSRVFINSTVGFSSEQLNVTYDGANGHQGIIVENEAAGTSSHPAMYFTRYGSYVGAITQNRNSTAFVTSSDYRLKENVTPMSGAIARVKLLKPCNFDWISTGENVDGFIAHEAQEIVPESVHGTKDAMMDEEYEVTPAVLDDEGNETTAAVMGTRSVPDMQGIDQSKLIPLLTATIQELIARIEALEGAAP